MSFLPTLPPSNDNSERESNPISKPLYTRLSGSAFLVQSSTVKTVFISEQKFEFPYHLIVAFTK